MDKKKQIKNITLWGLVANIVLSVIKLAIGLAGHSQAVVADALHSFSDTFSDLVILFGVKYWTAPPDDAHPYGHQKIESFVSITIGLILIVAAFSIGYSGVITFMDPQPSKIAWIVLIGPLLSMVIKEILFRVTFKVGIKTNSSSLKANAWHHRTDALSSIPVLIAVVGSLINPKFAFLDPLGAIVVSAFIIKIGLEILFTNINDLLDTGISEAELAAIEKDIRAMPNVKGVHKMRTRKLANAVFIDLHLEVDGRLSVTQGHDISEEVKHYLIEKHPKIIEVLVHLEPEQNSSLLME